MVKLEQMFSKNFVIASVNTMEDFLDAVNSSQVACIMLKFGDIENLMDLVKTAHYHKKYVIVHIDAVKGIARDIFGIRYLAKIGVDCIDTTKPQLIAAIKSAGMIALQVMFLVDTEALRMGIDSINKNKPDAVIIMPMSIPASVLKKIEKNIGCKIILGGLAASRSDIDKAIKNGAAAVVASRHELWQTL